MSSAAPQTSPVSEESWDLVADTVAGRPHPTVETARRRLTRVLVVSLVAAVVIGAGAGLLVGASSSASGGGLDALVQGESRAGWPGAVGLVGNLVGLLCMIVGVVVFLVRNRSVGARAIPLAGVPRREQQWIGRMALGRVPCPPHRVAEVRAVAAGKLRTTASTAFLVGGVCAITLARVVSTEWSVVTGVFAIGTGFLVVVLVATLHTRAQWRAFLQETEPPAGAEPVPVR